MPANVHQAEDIKPQELIEIGDVVKYIKQELIAKIRSYFNGIAYKPDKALGSDKYTVDSTRDQEAHRYWDEDSSLVQEIVGNGKKGTLIRASDIVNALQLLVQQLARFRKFSSSGKIKYYLTGNCSNGDCPSKTGAKYKVDPDIEATSGFLFLPAKSSPYTGDIQKTVGGTVKTDAVINTKDSIATNPGGRVSAGSVLDAAQFKSYITDLYAEWQKHVSDNAIEYYSETCYKGECHYAVTHCYKACDGRSRR